MQYFKLLYKYNWMTSRGGKFVLHNHPPSSPPLSPTSPSLSPTSSTAQKFTISYILRIPNLLRTLSVSVPPPVRAHLACEQAHSWVTRASDKERSDPAGRSLTRLCSQATPRQITLCRYCAKKLFPPAKYNSTAYWKGVELSVKRRQSSLSLPRFRLLLIVGCHR